MKKRQKMLLVFFAMLLVMGSLAGVVGADEPVELQVYFPVSVGNYQDAELIEEEINKIAVEKINTKIKLNFLRFGNYLQQTNLMLAANEQVDLMPATGTLSLWNSQGHLLPLDELLKEYGKDIQELVEEDLFRA